MDNRDELKELISKLGRIQGEFYKKFGVKDIYTNSKFFEILIANVLNHLLIPGHSGSRDAKDKEGEYEYKHFKETSGNHSWTFNDFSDNTIHKLKDIEAVIFAHIDDTGDSPLFDWYYYVPGITISDYLAKATVKIGNTRMMINISPKQIEGIMKIKKILVPKQVSGIYSDYLDRIFEISRKIEKIVGTKNILTSNKIWEILLGIILNHNVISEQTQFDAKDKQGNLYEYKISKSYSFNFQDISENVLQKFTKVKGIIMAVVDKDKLAITHIYEADPREVIPRLRQKLNDKRVKYEKENKKLRRLQVSLSKKDLSLVGAIKIL